MNPKQQRFVEEYLIDLNGKQAAIRAGYSSNTAEVTASRLLSNVKVAAAVAERKEARSEKTGVDAAWLLRRLADEAEADVADLYDENGHLKPVHDWPPIWRKGLVAGIETVREKIGENGDGEPEFATVQKIKISDRVKRLELIGKHIDVEAFKERVEHTLSDDAAALLAEARRSANVG